jgi:CRISPR/Cas system-associated exonuclease Cas4 (RecB family)
MIELLLLPALTQDTIRVSALNALAYCPRLFYLEEVEELYTQDAAVFAGRRLHVELEKQADEEWEDLLLESVELGIRGRVDALRMRDGQVIPYEHKRGRSHRDRDRKLGRVTGYKFWLTEGRDEQHSGGWLGTCFGLLPSTAHPSSAVGVGFARDFPGAVGGYAGDGVGESGAMGCGGGF